VERKTRVQALSVHLSHSRAKELIRRPELLKPGAELQPLSILFSDIADFSSISERMSPGELADMLNKYFEASMASIHHTRGMVVKLIGDAIFAIWNAPEKQADHHERACRAALLLRDQLERFELENPHLPRLRTRVGLHHGPACVGNFGSPTRFDYTAIGDAVNLASRLEGLNKFLGTDILATDAMLEPVASSFAHRSVGRFQFKGFKRHVEVRELLCTAEQLNGNHVWIAAFHGALERFQGGDFDAAEAGFHRTKELHREDGPAGFYLRQIARLWNHPPVRDWQGQIELSEK
jgi:adenylate cyclase